MNKIILTGRITHNLEIYKTEKQISILKNSIAVKSDFKNPNGEYDTYFIDFVAFGGTADVIAKHFQKGDRIGLIGRLQTRTYENKEGKKVKVCEVNVENIEFLQDRRNDNQSNELNEPAFVDNTSTYVVDDGDLPF